MKRWLPLLAVLWSPLALAVQGLQLSPIGVELAPGEQAAAITVTNHDPVAHVLQVEVRRWRQRGAEPVLAPASRLLASPPLFQLAPGASQIVRFGFPEPLPAGSVERAWRLFFTEVPGHQAAPPKAGAIRVLLRLSVPVFQAPRQADDALQWSRTASGLRLKDTGNRHLRVLALTARAPGQPSWHRSGLWYLLPGGDHDWKLPKALAQAPVLDLSLETDRGALTARLPASGVR